MTPFFHNNLSICCFPWAECKPWAEFKMLLGKKSNVQRYIENNCRDKTSKNKVCPICNITFTQKCNRARRVFKLHKNEIGNDSSLGSVTSREQGILPSFVSDDNDNNVIAESFPENLNSSFLSDNS